MQPASHRGAGSAMAFPDVCMTPAGPAEVPVGYPNIAMNAQATPFATTVKVGMVNALNLASKIPKTSGDEAGTASPNQGQAEFTMGNPIISIELQPAVNLTCPTTGNEMNAPLGAVVVPSLTNVKFTHRTSEAQKSDALGLLALRGLGDALRSAKGPRGELVRDRVGVLCVPVFALDVMACLHLEITALLRRGMTDLVLDLRGCPGGDLDACLHLAGDFIDCGREIARIEDGDGDEVIHRARHADPYVFPLILLVDHDTASAAELFAGCLQAHRRALVVGERTYGKGSAQAVLARFDEPGAAYATVATFTLPNGDRIQGRGIEPDISVASSDALEAALQAIAAISKPIDEVLR